MINADAIRPTLEAFRDDLASGKLDGFRGRPTALVVLDMPCPDCSGTLVTSWGRNWCLGDGCQFSWKPTSH